MELDANLYFVDELANEEAASYLRLDLRLGWQVAPDLDLSLIGRNLLDDAHPELTEFAGFSGEGLVFTQVERSVLLQGKWRF